MKLRKLLIKDAPLMLEWMHDVVVVHYLRRDFANKKEEDCIRFISESKETVDSIHLAIVNDFDEYMGTVSLKHIQQNIAEVALVLRSSAMGKGYARFALREIIEYGHKTLGIDNFYWCVDPENLRAVQIYKKNNYKTCSPPIQAVDYTEEEKNHFLWYIVTIKS